MPPEDNPADDLPIADYDPYADLISANQEEIARIKAEGARRVNAAMRLGDLKMVWRIKMAMDSFHPMHCESWCGWPEGGAA